MVVISKRGSTFELNQDNVADALDSFDSVTNGRVENKIKLLTREEVEKSGRPIIRLKRSLNSRNSSATSTSSTMFSTSQSEKPLPKTTPVLVSLETVPSSTEEKKEHIDLQASPIVSEPDSESVTPADSESVTSVEKEEVETPSTGIEADTVSRQFETIPNAVEAIQKSVETSCETTSDVGAKSCETTSELVATNSDTTPQEVSTSAETHSTASIFGSFFSKPYTNPFAEAARQGDTNFSASVDNKQENASLELFKGSSIFTVAATTEPISTNQHTTISIPTSADYSRENDQDGSTTHSNRPAQFPGEELEKELFVECIPVETNHTTTLASESSSITQPQMKFKKQGEGGLKLLEAQSSDSIADITKTRRLVVRQKGTWTLLLNSPLWLSKTFELVPQISSGYGLRFVGLNNVKGIDNTLDSSSLAVYCIKFDTETRRQDFLHVIQQTS